MSVYLIHPDRMELGTIVRRKSGHVSVVTSVGKASISDRSRFGGKWKHRMRKATEEEETIAVVMEAVHE